MWTCAEFGHLQSADLCRVETCAECAPMLSGDLFRVGTGAERGLVHMGICSEWGCAEWGHVQSEYEGRVGTSAVYWWGEVGSCMKEEVA